MPGTYVIADIHGCLKTLDYLLDALIRPGKHDHVIFLGDLVNKGPNSKGVLDRLIQLMRAEYRVSCLRGNHDQIFLDAKRGGDYSSMFLNNGGSDTLQSFGVDEITEIPEKYFELIESLPFYIELDDYLLVHGGFNCAIDDPFEDIDSMLTIRNFKYNSRKLRGKAVVHGHNAISMNVMLENLIQKKSMIYNIDNGCVYSDREGMGNLVCLNLTDFSYTIQPNID